MGMLAVVDVRGMFADVRGVVGDDKAAAESSSNSCGSSVSEDESSIVSLSMDMMISLRSALLLLLVVWDRVCCGGC
jgi:hypothetical protein